MDPAPPAVPEDSVGARAFGIFTFAVGAALLTAPWWSRTLPPSDYRLTTVLGLLFGGGGLMAALPARWERLRTLAFTTLTGAFGAICAALALLPTLPGADGRFSVGGVPGFAAAPIPWWARLVAAAFALILLAASVAGLYGLLRALFPRSHR
jgi:hypothetical protein